MNPERLLQHFERISEAPAAIPRLRQFILDLAVRGKLVEQDSDDEPAAELLKRIEAEKARLVRKGNIKEPKTVNHLPKGESLYDVPDSWTWILFSDLISHSDAGVSPKTEGFPKSGNAWGVLKVSAVSWDKFNPDENKQLLPGATFPESAQVHIGDFLISRANTSELLAKCVIVEDQPKNIILSDKIVRLHITEYCEKKFLCFVNNHAAYARSYYASKGSGTSDSMKNVSRPIIYALPIPLPPLAEQHRIVARVDELMTLCDQLEAAKTEREQSRDRLVAASRHRLNSPADTAETDTPDLPARQADAIHDHARFVFEHLPRLTTRPEHIKQLRQTILNLAVRGKLVPQDPNDEPASELLKRIQVEKARLVKESKISRENLRIPAGDNKLAFGLKPGWQATKIAQILVELQTGPFGSSLHQSDYQKGGIPVINPASIKNERLTPIDGMAVGPATLERLATFKLHAGDIVMGRRGEMGRCAVVTEHEDGWLCGTGSLILRLPECVSSRFFVTLIGSPFVREYLGGSAVGATMQNLNQSILLNLLIGLPPLAEQHRIVARVDELMALCDQLEAQLTTTEVDSRRLLEAVLHEALSPLLEVTE